MHDIPESDLALTSNICRDNDVTFISSKRYTWTTFDLVLHLPDITFATISRNTFFGLCYRCHYFVMSLFRSSKTICNNAQEHRRYVGNTKCKSSSWHCVLSASGTSQQSTVQRHSGFRSLIEVFQKITRGVYRAAITVEIFHLRARGQTDILSQRSHYNGVAVESGLCNTFLPNLDR